MVLGVMPMTSVLEISSRKYTELSFFTLPFIKEVSFEVASSQLIPFAKE